MATCEHNGKVNSAPDSVIESLPEGQAKAGRHKCVICAYNEGLAVKKGKQFKGIADTCSHGAAVPRDMLDGLPENQGGLGRHKCAYSAFQAGL